MEMTNDTMSRMQLHLGLLRMCMGMTQEKFGEELGMSRQQIWNIEHGKNRLTKLHYLAIQWIFHQKEGLIGPRAEEEAGKFTLARMVYDFVIMSPELFNDDGEEEEIISLLYSVAPLYLRVNGESSRKMIRDGFVKKLIEMGYDDFYEDMKSGPATQTCDRNENKVCANCKWYEETPIVIGGRTVAVAVKCTKPE